MTKNGIEYDRKMITTKNIITIFLLTITRHLNSEQVKVGYSDVSAIQIATAFHKTIKFFWHINLIGLADSLKKLLGLSKPISFEKKIFLCTSSSVWKALS